MRLIQVIAIVAASSTSITKKRMIDGNKKIQPLKMREKARVEG
jgi:hypothetical protein